MIPVPNVNKDESQVIEDDYYEDIKENSQKASKQKIPKFVDEGKLN